MKTLLAALLIAGNAWGMDELTQQANHQEIIDQMKAQTKAIMESPRGGDTEIFQINMPAEPPAPPEPRCVYGLIRKGDGYETFTLKSGKTVLLYVQICDGRIQ